MYENINCFYEAVFNKNEEKLNRTALIYENDKISYLKLKHKVELTASLLVSKGIKKGNYVGCMLLTKPSYFYVCLACNMIGAVICGLAYKLPREQVEDVINKTNMKMVIYDQSVFDNYKNINDVLCISEEEILNNSNKAELTENIEIVNHSLQDEALILFTSGTTNKPKGAVLTNKNILASAYMENKYFFNEATYGINCFAACFPTNHVSGCLECGISPLIGGCCLVLYPKFDPKKIVEDISKYNITILSGVPAMWNMFLKIIENAKYDLSSIKYCISGAALLNKEIGDRILNYFPRIINPLGMTESSGFCTYIPNQVDSSNAYLTHGYPYSELDFKVIDDNKNKLGKNNIGRLCYKGDCIITRYLDCSINIDDEGYFVSEDIGYVDDEGFIKLCGRNDDMFTVGGYNVFPQEIEEVLMKYPGITGVVVAPIEHHTMGNVCKAFITVNDDIDLIKLEEFASKHLLSYKVPRTYEIVNEFNRNALGKITRKYYRNK